MRKFLAVALTVVLTSCSGGYTQEEVDGLVADAVDQAIDEQNERISEEEAQRQIEEGLKQASLAAAVDACEFSAYVTADEGGLVIEGEGEESPGAPITTVVCVLAELDIPSSVLTRISNTTSQMGLVEGEWADYSASWSYHPNNGLFIHIINDS